MGFNKFLLTAAMIGASLTPAKAQTRLKLYNNVTKPADSYYYSEAQRQRIYQKVSRAKPADNPVAVKTINHDPQFSDLGDISSDPADQHRVVSDWIDYCGREQKSGISYIYHQQRYNVSLSTMKTLDSTNRANLTRLGITAKPLLTFNNGDLAGADLGDTSQAVTALSFKSLTFFSLNALQVFEAHEGGHHLFHLRRRRQNLPEDSANNFMPIDATLEEFQADSVSYAFSGSRKTINALYELSAFNTRDVDLNDPTNKKFYALRNGFGLDVFDQAHPGTALRIQYIEALEMYRRKRHSRQAPENPPEKPPIIFSWYP